MDDLRYRVAAQIEIIFECCNFCLTFISQFVSTFDNFDLLNTKSLFITGKNLISKLVGYFFS